MIEGPCQRSKMDSFAKIVGGFKNTKFNMLISDERLVKVREISSASLFLLLNYSTKTIRVWETFCTHFPSLTITIHLFLQLPSPLVVIGRNQKKYPVFNVNIYFTQSAMLLLQPLTLHKKWSFPLRVSSVNITKSTGNRTFCSAITTD